MPDLTVVSPSAVVPADRLTLGATDARACPHPHPTTASLPGMCLPYCACMAEE
jgi:hypothetical protein